MNRSNSADDCKKYSELQLSQCERRGHRYFCGLASIPDLFSSSNFQLRALCFSFAKSPLKPLRDKESTFDDS